MIRQTSILAYYALNYEELSQIYREILSCLKESDGMTDMEICQKLGYSDPNKVRPRSNELMKLNLIWDYGKRHCSITGKLVHYWGITPVSDGTKFPMENKIKNRYII